MAVRRFETPPGKRKGSRLGLLGALAAAALDQKLSTLSRMHEEGFRQLGGVPAEILHDRMRTIWVDVDERGREPSGLEDFNAQLRA